MLSCRFQTKVLDWAKVTSEVTEDGAVLNDGNSYFKMTQFVHARFFYIWKALFLREQKDLIKHVKHV